jgi:polysaccharide deacetylase 2 family uncharacterized protein YibQ
MIKRKKLSWPLGAFSVALIFVWVAIIFVGMIQENERASLKEIVGQKVSYGLPFMTKPVGTVAIVLDDSCGDIQAENLINVFPSSVTFGLSPYNKFIYKNIVVLSENNRDFLVNIPLVSNKKNSKKLDLFPALTDKEIVSRIDNINTMVQGGVGFYSTGNDDFLKRESAFEAAIKKIYDLKSAFLYGIKNKTAVLEPEDGTAFKISAFDIEVSDHNKEYAFRDLENLIESKGIAVALINVSEQNIAEVKSWMDSLKIKNIEIVPVEQLWQKK